MIGHVNALRGLAALLKKRGHRVIFAIDSSWRGNLVADGYEEEIYSERPNDQGIRVDPATKWSFMIRTMSPNFRKPPLEALRGLAMGFKPLIKNNKYSDPQIAAIISKVKPDIIISDLPLPSIPNSGIPYISFCSLNPLTLPNENKLAPPSGLGLSIDDKSEWNRYRDEYDEIMKDMAQERKEWFASTGAPAPIEGSFLVPSKYMNLYLYPEVLDYTDIRPLPSHYLRIESLVREDNDVFEIPEQLRKLPGKLIYLSMGSMGSADLDLMKRLTLILGKSEHRFIVSKGVLHDQYDLPPNMWGEKFVPQLAVLPMVDLFISHGGNNSVTEGLYFGKPMIVLPLYGDQNDNATRIQEKGLGLTFRPYQVSEEQILPAIDALINDENLKSRLDLISANIRNSKSAVEAVNSIENLANYSP